MDSTYSFYIFNTKRNPDDEFWGFLSSRSSYYIDKDGEMISIPGNPVLRHSTEEGSLFRENSKSDGSIIAKSQMIEDLGFQVEVLFDRNS